MNLNIILFWTGIILGFLSIAYGAYISGKSEGKFKSGIIFIIIAAIVFIAKETFNISGLFKIPAVEFVRQGANIGIILSIFFAVFILKQMIVEVNNKVK